jgi:ABC-type antimicrobial peptide transport system permease subunit
MKARGTLRSRLVLLRENVGLAVGTLADHRFRSFLTILGVFIGVVIIVGVASVLNGFRQSVVDQVEEFGTNNIYVYRFPFVNMGRLPREIGVRKAIGARQRDIRLQFLVESVTLSCIGGGIGVAATFVLSWVIRTYSPLPARFPVWAPLLFFGICAFIGVFFGLQPARKAARLSPIDALRSE